MKKIPVVVFLFGLLFAQNQEWVARYNGPGGYHDGARAMTVGNQNNVYVTGVSYGSNTHSD